MKPNNNNKKTVLFCECGRTGGSVKRLVNLLNHIDLSRFSPSILTFYDDSKAAELIQFKSKFPVYSMGVTKSSIPELFNRIAMIRYPSLFFFRYLFSAWSTISITNPDLIYINNTPYCHIPILLLAKFLKKKVVCHLRDTVQLTRIELQSLKWAKRAIALSKFHAEYYAAQGVSQDKITVIYNGIDLREFDAQSCSGIVKPEKQNVVAFVSTLFPRKRWKDVIEAADILRNELSEFMILFLGDGADRPAVEREITKRNLRDIVQTLGFVPNVAPYLKVSKLGLMVSDREGMPNVILEYMAAGLPVIATDLPGVSEMVQDGINGILISPKRPDLLASSIKKLLFDNKLNKKMGEASRSILESGRFTVADEIKSIEELIANV